MKSDSVTQESPPEGNTTRLNFETSPLGFETGLESKRAPRVFEKAEHANDRKIMPAQQDRMAERLRSMITRKSNVNGLWQRPPG
jgi:hypothetical protein